MSNSKTIDGKTLVDAVGNLVGIVEGDREIETDAYDEATGLGLNRHQIAVARNYAGDGRVDVHGSDTPCLAEKLAAGTKLPWTFVLDGVEFVVKCKYGAQKNSNTTEWFWREDGYRFNYYKHDHKTNEIRIEEVED